MVILALAQFVIGIALASVGAAMIDMIDDVSGRRPGGYGSNISYHPVYTTFAQVGCLLTLAAPFTLMLTE